MVIVGAQHDGLGSQRTVAVQDADHVGQVDLRLAKIAFQIGRPALERLGDRLPGPIDLGLDLRQPGQQSAVVGP
jgi:hypothetical protein